LGLLSNATAVGEFTAGMRFVTTLRVIPGAILNTLLPEFSNNNENKKYIKTHLIFFIFLFGFSISFLLWLIAEPLMMLTFGFESAIPVLKILAWGFVLTVCSFSCEAYLISQKKEKFVNFSLVIALISTLISALIYVPTYGAIGASISAIVGEAFLLIAYLLFIAREKLLILKRRKIDGEE
jgi:O-antigen/teichoic acid export membrane protein